MAPELRAKRRSASTPNSRGKSEGSAAVKRKAADDSASPASKKTKPLRTEVSLEQPPKTVKSDVAKRRDNKTTPENNEHPFSDEDEDQALVLAGLSDSEADEADPDDDVAFKPGQDVGTIPEASKEVEKDAKLGKGAKEDSGIVYVGRIPHGFYEHEMRSYFGQFGDITRLRLSRNKRTGASKHFAFIEFAEESTAEIVVKAMNNYLLFGHILKCRMIPKSQVHENLFKGANKRYKAIPQNKVSGNILKKARSESQWAAKVSKENQRRTKRAEKLKELGYEFEAPVLKAAVALPAADAEEIDEVIPQVIEAPPEAIGEEADEISPSNEDLAVKAPAKGSKKTKKSSKPKKAKA